MASAQQDVEMKETQRAAPSNSVTSAAASSTLQRKTESKTLAPPQLITVNAIVSSTDPLSPDLKEIASLIETGAHAKEGRRIVRAVRLTIMLRRKLRAPVVSAFLTFALTSGSEAHSHLTSYLPKVQSLAPVCWFLASM